MIRARVQILLGAFLLVGTMTSISEFRSGIPSPSFTGLSTSEKVGQMLQVRVYGDFVTTREEEYLRILDEIKRDHIGSVDLRVHLDGPNLVRPSPELVATTLNAFQAAAKTPLLVGADVERGVVARVSDAPDIPNVMAWGAAGDLRSARLLGETTAQEARAVGIHWTFAPVVDVNSDPDNPIIGDRSFGDDPSQVGNMAAEFIRGAHSKGLLTTAKHFPGHGDTDIDSHVGIVTLNQDLKHLNQVEFPPFEKAIAAGVDAVMLAHARVPALESDPNKITTTSEKIIGGTLRGNLGFRGVVVTDSMEMRGLTELYKGYPNPTARAAVEAVKAGADIIMLPDNVDSAYQAILDAVRSGEIPESRIDESVRRILAMKERVGLFQQRFVDVSKVSEIFSRKSDWELAQQVADNAVVLVRNESFALPQPAKTRTSREGTKSEKIALVLFTDSSRSPLGKAFEETFKDHQPQVQTRYVYYDNRSTWETSDLINVVNGADRVIIAAFMTNLPGKKDVAHGKIVSVVGLNGQSAQLLSQILGAAGQKAMVVSLGSPYLILKFPMIQNYICTFSISSTSERAAVKALFGEIQNHAKLPVTLPGVANRGYSLPWPSRSVMSTNGR